MEIRAVVFAILIKHTSSSLFHANPCLQNGKCAVQWITFIHRSPWGFVRIVCSRVSYHRLHRFTFSSCWSLGNCNSATLYRCNRVRFHRSTQLFLETVSCSNYHRQCSWAARYCYASNPLPALGTAQLCHLVPLFVCLTHYINNNNDVNLDFNPNYDINTDNIVDHNRDHIDIDIN